MTNRKRHGLRNVKWGLGSHEYGATLLRNLYKYRNIWGRFGDDAQPFVSKSFRHAKYRTFVILNTHSARPWSCNLARNTQIIHVLLLLLLLLFIDLFNQFRFMQLSTSSKIRRQFRWREETWGKTVQTVQTTNSTNSTNYKQYKLQTVETVQTNSTNYKQYKQTVQTTNSTNKQ